MSEYREQLQDALIARRRPESAPCQRFYEVCEFAAYAAFLAGWAAALVGHGLR